MNADNKGSATMTWIKQFSTNTMTSTANKLKAVAAMAANKKRFIRLKRTLFHEVRKFSI